MHIKITLLAMFFGLGVSSLAMSETDNSPASSSLNQKVEITTNQASKAAVSSTENKAPSSKKLDADKKKPSMADYCRKNTC